MIMSYQRVCSGGNDSNASNAKSQVREEGGLHSFCSIDNVWMLFGVWI